MKTLTLAIPLIGLALAADPPKPAPSPEPTVAELMAKVAERDAQIQALLKENALLQRKAAVDFQSCDTEVRLLQIQLRRPADMPTIQDPQFLQYLQGR